MKLQDPTITNGQVLRTKTEQKIREQANVMAQMYLTNNYRTFHPSTKEYAFFLAPHGTFSKIDHIPNHKPNLNRFFKFGITHCIFSDQHELKLEFHNNTTYRNTTNLWKQLSTEFSLDQGRNKDRN